MAKKEIKGIECRFVVYAEHKYNQDDDCHIVKEIIHYTDGTSEPNLRLIKNFERDFYIVKKGQRDFNDPKEYIKTDRCLKYKSTQRNLVNNIAKAIEEPWFRGNLRKLCRNPYIFGADILSTAVIKKMYQYKYPELNTLYSVAGFDIETNIVDGSGEVIVATLSFKDKVFTAVKKSFVEGYTDVEDRLQKLLVKYLGEHVQKRNIKWEVAFFDRDADVIISCFNKAHEWQPDFVSIWNMDFDIPHSVKRLEKAGIDPAKVFSDPRVPDEYKFFNYVQGKKQKVTASGKVTPIKPAAQWHTVYCPSSFYIIDQMCTYKHVRISKPEEPSYSLNSILEKHLGIRKLNFKEAEGLDKTEWHMFMQSNYPLEYIIYNVFDCIAMEELDEDTKDLSLQLPLFSGCSDFSNFKSQPRRLVDALHYFWLENDLIIGCTSDQMSSELDKYTVSCEGWIVTLAAHLRAENGLRVIEEDPYMRTNIYAHVGDLDVSASYPNGEVVFNIGRETTHKELCKIEGVPNWMQRQQGINLSSGHTNAVEICTALYKLPTMETLLSSFLNQNI